jgi:uroporphyrinogen-III synthase
MRVVITRPASDAQAWVDALQAAGHSALALPLIEVGSATHAQPVADAWAQWPQWQAVMFVSAQAVRYFFERQPSAMRADAGHAASFTWAQGPRCWATGPGTHKALLQAGVPEVCIDSPSPEASQFDSEALWQRVGAQVQAGRAVLIVRGHDAAREPTAGPGQGTGRDWLAQQLDRAGASAQFVVAYERRPPVWTAAQRAAATRAATDGSVWCFSSSQAVTHLQQVLPAQDWSTARCVATHTRIAQTAKTLGFGDVHISRPLVADVLASLESLA